MSNIHVLIQYFISITNLSKIKTNKENQDGKKQLRQKFKYFENKYLAPIIKPNTNYQLQETHLCGEQGRLIISPLMI